MVLLQIVTVSPGTLTLTKIMSPSPEPLSPIPVQKAMSPTLISLGTMQTINLMTDSKTVYYSLLE